MPTITIKETTAASAVNTNLMAGHREQTKYSYRDVKKIGVVGSVNPGDASVDLFYGSTFVGTFFNSTGGANVIPKPDTDMMEIDDDNFCNPGEPINVIISDAGLTNVLVVTLVIEEERIER